MDQIANTKAEQGSKDAAELQEASDEPVTYAREWASYHPINLRVSIPLLFGRWYITLVAGPERRSKQRRIAERRKHSLETTPNLMLLLSIGAIGAVLIFSTTALILVRGFGWSIDLTIPM